MTPLSVDDLRKSTDISPITGEKRWEEIVEVVYPIDDLRKSTDISPQREEKSGSMEIIVKTRFIASRNGKMNDEAGAKAIASLWKKKILIR